MAKIKNAVSFFKKRFWNKLVDIKTNLKNQSQKFKENLEEAKSQPRSKRKSLFFSVLGIFGATLLIPVLSAVAKDFPKDTPKPGPSELCPSPTANLPVLLPSKQIVDGLSGAAATICALAVSSSSFTIGAICGLIVVIVVLKAQGK